MTSDPSETIAAMLAREFERSEAEDRIATRPPRVDLREAQRRIEALIGKPIAYSRLPAAVMRGEIAATKSRRGYLIERSALPAIALKHFR
jgi:hypothetical protein